MPRITTVSLTSIIAMTLAGATLPADAAALTKAESIAVKRAVVGCKAEAKGKKIAWLSRRKYVNHCVAEALREHPKIDVIQILKDHPDMKDLPMQNWDAI